MKICTMGLGYIGLPTSVMFAKYGADVVGVDLLSHVVEKLNAGEIHIEEPGLGDVLKEVVNNKKFKASLNPEAADVYIIAVPTPNHDDEYKSCDLSFVLQATKKILPYIKKGNVVIIESTIAPRSMDDHVKPLLEDAGFVVGKDIYLVHCPERVLPGKILHEIVFNNRIVGGVTEACSEAGAKVYELFVKGEIIKTNAKTAEMSKLMENTFRDVNIALANELTKICNDLEINVLEVIEMANKHPRVNIHQPGPGVGGHCLAVDPYFIVAKTPDLAKIIHLSRETNVSMPYFVYDKVKELIGYINRPKITVFGVTYKADVDDMRESPSMDVINLLTNAGYNLSIYDPHVETIDSRFMNLEEATKDSDLILLLTDHSEFKNLDYDLLSDNMVHPLMFDTRNCINPSLYNKMKVFNFGNIYVKDANKLAVLA
ncbi:nucleotide sugar dehydrogenase [Paenibacillus sp. GCM10027629]|uniref:nucleotide sugar dehydrogenase n=1 Tax=Paenibacillus sp. GCM10027629 TaxID=3273414 RepID=UPI00363A466B